MSILQDLQPGRAEDVLEKKNTIFVDFSGMSIHIHVYIYICVCVFMLSYYIISIYNIYWIIAVDHL